MAAALAEAGHDVLLACGRYQGAVTGLAGPPAGAWREGRVGRVMVREYPIACGNAQGLAARSLAFLRFAAVTTRLALGQRFDLILASSTPLTVAIPALLAHRARGIPFIFEIRDPWPELPAALGGVPRPVLAAMRALADAAYRRASLVIGLTEGMAALAAARGARRTAVLPQAADPAIAAATPWRPPGTEGLILAIQAGAMGPANGLDTLLDAAAGLRGTNILILLAGEGRERARLAARIEAESLPARLLDPMPKARLAGLLRGADIGLLCLAPVPAFAEWTAPNKLEDGLAAGLPMVVNVPGRAARRVDGAGIAVPPGDPAALAAALRHLAAEPALRASYAAAARARAVSAEAVAARLPPLLEAACRTY
jgi:glycosyltransferase involved in cell wall biosynthesis